MFLELNNDDDLRVIKQGLDIRLHQMREELAHTDDRDYRAKLRADLDRLEEVRGRLDPVVKAAG